jgi:mono/diheme cytochrome c family protein
MDDGKEVYADFCIQCHQANEKGMALISHLRRIKLATEKEPKVFMR